MSRPLSLAAALICGLLAVLLTAAPASAAKAQRTIFDAPRDLLNPATRPAALAELESLGVTDLRIVLYWRTVAPSPESRTRPVFDGTDPAAYAWGEYEALIAEAKARGWGVVLTPSGPVPRWATNGAVDQKTRPSPNEFRKFVTAASRQFGDRITTWSIWNEPNHPDFLLPQYDRRKRPQSPGIYRKLYAAAIRGLDAVGDRKPVLFGETAPVGTGKVVSPLRFLRDALCVTAQGRKRGSCTKLSIDGIAHHPYTRKTGPYFVPDKREDVTIGSLSRLVTFVQRTERSRVLNRGTGLHLTEFGIQSLPDPIVGVSQQRQEEYRAISEKIAYDQPRVETFSQYLLTDDDPDPDAPPIGRFPGFESGLKLAAGGRQKTAFDGFRLPVVARTDGSRVALWGLVRPGGATGRRTAELQIRSGASGRWTRLQTLSTNARGYWSARAAGRTGRQFRVVWTAPDGTIHQGAPTRATKRV